jgi:hypothetical protein
MIPDFTADGNLPPGEHPASLDEITQRFRVHSWRTRGPLTQALQMYSEYLENYTIQRIYVDGSYITRTLAPNDIDVTLVFADDFDLDSEAWRFKSQEWKRLGLDVHLYRQSDARLARHLQNWQTDQNSGIPKGIIRLESFP